MKTFLLYFFFLLPVSADNYDVFVSSGQSNAIWRGQAWGDGIEAQLVASGLFSNVRVIKTGHGANPLENWHNSSVPQVNYRTDFFNNSGTGLLQRQLDSIILSGHTYTFRGLFWWQGESDRSRDQGVYVSNFNNMVNELNNDVDSDDWYRILNTVGYPDTPINDTLDSIASSDSSTKLFDTQVSPYRTDPTDVHGYNHYVVGVDNAKLLIDSFVAIPEPSSTALLGLGALALLVRRKR